MTIFQLTSTHQILPIRGGAAWSFEDKAKPRLLGYSDNMGIIDIQTTNNKHEIRFLSEGHTAADYSGEDAEKIEIFMTRNHPGSYSGFLAGSRIAVWHNEELDRYFEFTALGHYRKATGYRHLMEEEHRQFKMQQRTKWHPPGPTVKKPSGGVIIKLPPLPDLKWSYLSARSDKFPTDDKWVSIVGHHERRFRFPSPGVMIVNSSEDSASNDGTEYKLLS